MINVIRDIPAPASLAGKTSYRNDDVIDALYQIFRKKCYLTEKVFDSPREMEIDHFVPQNEQSDLIHVWHNLYPIDNKANKQRPKTVPTGGYLDPCDPADDVEQEILYIVECGGNALFKPRDLTNQKAVNTAELLNRVHRDLKEAVSKRHHEVVNAVARWYHAKKQYDPEQELEQELTLRKLLSRDSQYTMLMRSIQVVPHEFFD